ncbi:hypothetical protein [Nocardiopsis suaedae]|uniref:CopG family transcriptional regulator n=1 Tax=Nocardiopsis suaedae TaxID=3018444 RepID=A0ABT4TW40_9ACTN|nr:hypothetical protein [Nocardiopsis suaedae]MDA2808913.1 hypothetical protein [Nocardiopsis suaedae]
MEPIDIERLAEEFDASDQSAYILRSEPGTPTDAAPTVIIPVAFPKPLLDEIRRLADRRRVGVDRLLREWAEAGLRRA